MAFIDILLHIMLFVIVLMVITFVAAVCFSNFLDCYKALCEKSNIDFKDSRLGRKFAKFEEKIIK